MICSLLASGVPFYILAVWEWPPAPCVLDCGSIAMYVRL